MMGLGNIRQKIAGRKTLIMGILNLTPDSFYDGSRHNSLENAVKHSGMMIECGVDIIDIGGESSRPGSESVSLEEESSRVIPVIEALVKQFDEIRTGKILLSVDTYKSPVAERALDCGVSIINDISGLRFDPAMVKLASERNVPVVVMHMKGVPKHMQDNPDYSDVVCEIKSFFQERIDFLTAEGIRKENIILDPGIGFGKTTAHNLEILARLKEFRVLGCPLQVGTSRK
jgi:dihydropteroate synthase